MAEVSFVAHGRPAGKGSKRALVVRGQASAGQHVAVFDTNARAVKPWEANLRAHAAEAMDGGALWRGPVHVEVVFYFARPRSHYGTGRNAGTLRASAPQFMSSMPDLDKLLRCVLDSLSGIAVKDDSQVSRLLAGKFYGEPERAEVRVREL